MDSQIPRNPVQAWRDIAWSLDETFDDERIRQFNCRVAWAHNSTFEVLQSRFIRLRESVPGFFESNLHDWSFSRASYEFPQEVLLQNFALEAQLSLFVNQPAYLPSGMPPICPRLTSHWNIRQGTPTALPAVHDFSFIAVPFSWMDLVSLAASSLANDGYSFFARAFPEVTTTSKNAGQQNIFDTLTGRLSVSRFCVPELLQQSVIHKASQMLGFEAFARPLAASTVRAELETASLRFTIAHEVGHAIDATFGAVDSTQSELFADEVALCLSRLHMDAEPDLYQWAQPRSIGFLQCLGAEMFFYVYALWRVSLDSLDDLEGADSTNKSQRHATYMSRLRAYERVRNAKGMVLPKADEGLLDDLRQLWSELLGAYEEHLRSRLPEVNSIVDDLIQTELEAYPDPWDLSAYSVDIDMAVEELSKADISVVNELGALKSMSANTSDEDIS